MMKKIIFVFGIFLFVGAAIFVDLLRFFRLDWELSLGFVLIGICSLPLVVLMLSPRSKLGRGRTPVIVQLSAGVLMGLAFAAEGEWGSRWPFLAWVATIASIIWLVSLKLLVDEIRKVNAEEKDLSRRI